MTQAYGFAGKRTQGVFFAELGSRRKLLRQRQLWLRSPADGACTGLTPFAEEWADRAALEAHFAVPVRGLVAAPPEMRVWEAQEG